MHLPVLEGRYQPALKIDATEERGCAAAEGENAEIRGRWQLVAWISASQTGPMAILRFPCPAQSCEAGWTCSAQQRAVEAMQKEPRPAGVKPITDASPWDTGMARWPWC